MIDKRLLGTWKSDSRKTLRELRLRRDVKPNQLQVFATLFGRLELRFTRLKVYSKFKDWSRPAHYSLSSRRYRVIGMDECSVAIQYSGVFLSEERIQHIHFDGGCYWINIGPYREWFKRLP